MTEQNGKQRLSYAAEKAFEAGRQQRCPGCFAEQLPIDVNGLPNHTNAGGQRFVCHAEFHWYQALEYRDQYALRKAKELVRAARDFVLQGLDDPVIDEGEELQLDSWRIMRNEAARRFADFEYDHFDRNTEPQSDSPEASQLQIAQERIGRLEAVLSVAITTERQNSDAWMQGFQDALNKCLAADGDHRRCTYDGTQLRLRSIRQSI
ncbi:MAG: hypothetical protein Fues2KO_45560 [Fuerstiella sp.]